MATSPTRDGNSTAKATDSLAHLGIIADGNRRWAKERGLPSIEGHRAGLETVEKLLEYLVDTDVKIVSFYLFSSENWNRSTEELSYLMKLAHTAIANVVKKAQKANIRIKILGRPEKVDPALWQKLLDAETTTKDNTALTACVCFNYGGQWEIADAATRAIEQGVKIITPEVITENLYHPEIPPVDLIIRTSGEERTSGFMLWRAAYAELMFTKKYFPDLTGDDLDQMLAEYRNRQRRFGK